MSGIGTGDILMVHSSLSRIGNVIGSAETVIKSFIDVVTVKGTIIMPCYNSAELVIQDLKRGRILDLRKSPSSTGKITETFRSWHDIHRSSHPFSSVCAWGRQARYITAGHATKHNVCHSASPIGRLVELSGKVVGIGISIAQGFGIAHYLEDSWDEFPFEVHSSPFEVTYIDTDGNTIRRKVSRFDPKVSRTRIDYPEGSWICEKLTGHLARKGILKWFDYGEADAWVMEAVELYRELRRLAEKGITMYLTEKRLTDRNREIDKW